jgi:hypothetical protein
MIKFPAFWFDHPKRVQTFAECTDHLSAQKFVNSSARIKKEQSLEP